jgi:predicted secreted protein
MWEKLRATQELEFLVLLLSEADAGSRPDVRVGDQVVVELAEKPTTGYRWQVDVDAARARVVDDTFLSASDAMGAPGRRRLTFEVLQAGEVDIRLRNARSWDPENAVGEFSVTLEAAAAS